ncbi:hypothetical protein TA3x_000648 [Tundrisphaera sp. TA3]|uniref:hypothetical protein n=1 Tax=Tundrisphaera sp. TA3 TaxID=3435775 RepID=UPI003EBB9C9A
MNSPLGADRSGRPFQLRLGTVMIVIIGIATLLGVVRRLGPGAPFGLIQIVSLLLGIVGGCLVRRRLCGAILGGLLPILYVLSIEVAAHVGHRAGWPAGMLRLWEFYSSVWFSHSIDSPSLWSAYWTWETLCVDLRAQYGADTPLASQFFVNLIAVAAISIMAARKIHAAMLMPLVAVVAGTGLAIGHDLDATFLGCSCGLIIAIPLAGRGRRKREPRINSSDNAEDRVAL